MQRISLAPVLSATFSRDSCWIIPTSYSSCPIHLRRSLAIGGLLGLLDDLGDPPALGRRQGPGLGQPDDVARAGGVLLVVGLEPGRPPDRLLVQAVLADVLHLDDHRLVHLVGDHDPGADLAGPAGAARGRVLLGHWRSLSSARSRWCITVRTLAMSLRTSRSRCGLSSWPVTFWNRRLNSSSLASASLAASSSASRSASSLAFMVITPRQRASRTCTSLAACGRPGAWPPGRSPRGRPTARTSPGPAGPPPPTIPASPCPSPCGSRRASWSPACPGRR